MQQPKFKLGHVYRYTNKANWTLLGTKLLPGRKKASWCAAGFIRKGQKFVVLTFDRAESFVFVMTPESCGWMQNNCFPAYYEHVVVKDD